MTARAGAVSRQSNTPTLETTDMKISVDDDKCCGSGNCVLIAPDVFDQRDEDGIVVLLDSAPTAHLHTAVREAADVCPAAAIHVDEQS
jgi:ferredoxin